MTHTVPEKERADRASIERVQRRKLADMLCAVVPANSFYGRKLGSIKFDPERDPLDALPFTTRAEVQQDQHDATPYGTNLTFPLDQYTRVHQTSASSGEPLHWLDTPASWTWWKHCWEVIYRAAGVVPEDRLMFPFAFGPFIGFWGAFEAATALGNFTLPAGGMSTTARIAYLLDHRATYLCCTPTYALRMLEVAEDEGTDLGGSTVRGLIVAGEPGGCIAATRSRIERGFGARVFDHAGMTEMGPWGFECEEAPGGLHVIESEFVAEVINPAGDSPVSDGHLGELVLTNLGRIGSPLIRYRTGDQVRMTREPCVCGRWFARMEGGVLGRLDDMLLIRGNNVFPSAIEGVVREYEQIVEFQLETLRAGAMTDLVISIEILASKGHDATNLAQHLARTVRDRLHFMPKVRIVESGSLPRFELKAKRLVKRGRGS